MNKQSVHISLENENSEKDPKLFIGDDGKLNTTYREIFNEMNFGFALVELQYNSSNIPVDFKILSVNHVIEKFLGQTSDDIKDKTFVDLFGKIDHEWLDKISNSLHTLKTIRFQKYSAIFNRYLKATIIPATNDVVSIIVEDVSAYVKAESGKHKYMKEAQLTNEKLNWVNKDLLLNQSELEKANLRLMESEERWMFALEGGSRAVFDFNFNTGNYFFSKSWHELFGYTEEELTGFKNIWFDLAHPEDINKLRSKYNDFIAGKDESLSKEIRLLCRDKTYKWVIIKAKIIQFDKKRHAERIIGTLTDISSRKQTEQALMESEARLKEAQNLGKLGYWNYNISTEELYWSDQLYKILDFNSEEFTPSMDLFHSEIHTDDVNVVEQAYHNIIKGNTVHYNIYYRVVTRSNKIKYVHEICNKHQDDVNNEVLFGIIQDITQLRTIEEEFRKTKDKFDALFESADDRIAIFDLSGKLIYTNSAFYDAIGYTETEYSEKFLPTKYESNFISKGIFNELVRNGKATIEYSIENKQNELQHMFAKYVGIERTKTGQFNMVLAIIRDITKFKITEYELTRAKEKAEESDKLKSAFLANMSHEIRTPLNGILGFVKLLLKDNLSTDKRNYYSTLINTNADQLLAIISDIIDIAKIESGQIEVNFERINLNKCLEDIYETYCQIIDLKRYQVELKVEKSIDNPQAGFVTDYLKFSQIMKNLLNNALKFTVKGKITFGYRFPENERILFYVKDTGIGISEEDQKIIFERFRQADDSTTRTYGGAGLGLTISSQLIERMKGKIWVESKKNKGSTFYFELPYMK